MISQLPSGPPMKFRWLKLSICACLAFAAISASAQTQLDPNQTNGFGKLVTFTYLQNFDCVDQSTLDSISTGSRPSPIRMRCKRRFARW